MPVTSGSFQYRQKANHFNYGLSNGHYFETHSHSIARTSPRPLKTASFYCHSMRVTLPRFSGCENARLFPNPRGHRGGIPVMHDTWKDMFVIGLPLAEKILRPIIVYVFLVVSLRLSGKRELVQLNPFDLVVLLTLSNTVQNAIIGEDNSVLEPGGTLTFLAKKPTGEDVRHQQLLGKLELLAQEIALLRSSQPPARA